MYERCFDVFLNIIIIIIIIVHYLNNGKLRMQEVFAGDCAYGYSSI